MIYATFLAANFEGDRHNAKKFVDLLESDFNISISDFMKSRLWKIFFYRNGWVFLKKWYLGINKTILHLNISKNIKNLI